MNTLSIILLIFAAIILIAGIAIFAGWNPFVKKEEGKEKEPLNRKDKMFVLSLLGTLFLSFITCFFAINPPWFAKLKNRNNSK